MLLLIEIIIFVVVMLGLIYVSISAHNKKNANNPKKAKKKTISTVESKELGSHWHRKMLALEEDLEKRNKECKELKNTIEMLKKKETEVLLLVEKNREWADESKEEARHFKKIIEGLKEKNAQKDKDQEKEFSRNVRLNQDLNQVKEELKAALKSGQDKEEQIQLLNSKIQRYIKEAKEQTQKLNEMIDKQKHSSWVSRDDYYELKEQYDDARALLEIRMNELSKHRDKILELEAEIVKLKNQLVKEKPPVSGNHQS